MLRSHGTWNLAPRPVNASVVGCRLVYTIKYTPCSSVDRYKARLVARGFTQTFGIDYAVTFSPVVRLNSIRVLLFIVIN